MNLEKIYRKEGDALFKEIHFDKRAAKFGSRKFTLELKNGKTVLASMTELIQGLETLKDEVKGLDSIVERLKKLEFEDHPPNRFKKSLNPLQRVLYKIRTLFGNRMQEGERKTRLDSLKPRREKKSKEQPDHFRSDPKKERGSKASKLDEVLKESKEVSRETKEAIIEKLKELKEEQLPLGMLYRDDAYYGQIAEKVMEFLPMIEKGDKTIPRGENRAGREFIDALDYLKAEERIYGYSIDFSKEDGEVTLYYPQDKEELEAFQRETKLGKMPYLDIDWKLLNSEEAKKAFERILSCLDKRIAPQEAVFVTFSDSRTGSQIYEDSAKHLKEIGWIEAYQLASNCHPRDRVGFCDELLVVKPLSLNAFKERKEKFEADKKEQKEEEAEQERLKAEQERFKAEHGEGYEAYLKWKKEQDSKPEPTSD